MAKEEKDPKEEEGKNEETQFQLNEDGEKQLKEQIKTENPDLSDDEFEQKFEEEKSKTIEAAKELHQKRNDIVASLKEDDENKDKSDEELIELANQKLEEELSEGEEGSEDDKNKEEKPKDTDKPWWETETPADPAKNGQQEYQAPEGYKLVKDEDYSSIEQQAKQLNEVIQDPFFQSFQEFKRQNEGKGDISQFIRQTGIGVDYQKMPADDLYEKYLNDIATQENIPAEETEAALEEFKELSAIEKAQRVRPIRSEYKQMQGNSLEKLTETYETLNKDRQQKLQKGVEELETKTNDLVGKRYYGLEMTKERSERVKSYITNEFRLHREDGTPDVEKYIKYAVADLFLNHLVKENVEKGRARGVKSERKTRSNAGVGMLNMVTTTPSGRNDGWEESKKKAGIGGKRHQV